MEVPSIGIQKQRNHVFHKNCGKSSEEITTSSSSPYTSCKSLHLIGLRLTTTLYKQKNIGKFLSSPPMKQLTFQFLSIDVFSSISSHRNFQTYKFSRIGLPITPPKRNGFWILIKIFVFVKKNIKMGVDTLNYCPEFLWDLRLLISWVFIDIEILRILYYMTRLFFVCQ